MPRLPRGLRKRKVHTAEGVSTVFVWRSRGDGKDVRISLGSDYGIALAEYRRLEREGPPAPPAAPTLTLEAFSQRWLAEYAASRRIPRGRAQAAQRFRDYLWPILGQVPLSELKPADLRRLNAELETRGVGLVTRRRLLEDLRCTLRYAVEEAEVLDRSPWRRGILPSLPEAAPRPLNELELAEVHRVAPERWKPVLQLMACTGLRWGEIRALRWEDVRESPYRHLVVSRSHDGPTKSRKVREVPLLPEAQDVLEALSRDTGPVFPWLPETASWIRRYVRRHARIKGLDFHVHRLRHTFATKWLEQSGTVETLQQVLGHSTVKLTERYGRLRPWAVAAEARRMGNNAGITGTVGGTVARATS